MSEELQQLENVNEQSEQIAEQLINQNSNDEVNIIEEDNNIDQNNDIAEKIDEATNGDIKSLESSVEIVKDENEQPKDNNNTSNSSTEKLPSMPSMTNFQNPTHDIGIDWYHFETRIRKVILEVVDPLIKKQFKCFEGLDDARKDLKSMKYKYEDVVSKVDRVNKRNEVIETLEKKMKDLENELNLFKALQRTDYTQLVDRFETLSTRIKVLQTDINQYAKIEEKIKVVQKSILDVTEEYNVTVTNRIKDMTHGFIKQIQDLDTRYRESHRDLQSVLVKIDGVHAFTQKNDSRFNQLQSFINELRETFEENLIAQSRGITSVSISPKPVEGEENSAPIEIRLRQKILELEKQIEDFKGVIDEQGNAIQNNINALTNNRIEQLIFQNQIELFERIFSIKVYNIHSSSNNIQSPFQSSNNQSKKKKKSISVNDYQVSMMQNYRHWRNIQIEKGRFDIDFKDFDPTLLTKSRGFGFKNFMMGDNLNEQNEKIVEEEETQEALLKKQLELLTKSSDQLPMDEETKERIEKLRIIDQETLIEGIQAAQKDYTISTNPRKPSIISSGSANQPNLKLELEATVEPSQNSEDEQDEDVFDLQKHSKRRSRMNSMLQVLTEDRIKEVLLQEMQPIKDQQNQFSLQMASISSELIQLSIQFNQEPLLNIIGKNRQMIENLSDEIAKLKQSDGRASLSQQIHKLDQHVTQVKNDLLQQIYKIKDFDEQLYQKSVEISQKLDNEIASIRKKDQDLKNRIDELEHKNRSVERESAQFRDYIDNLSNAIMKITEIDLIGSAMEQQEEIDRRSSNDTGIQVQSPVNLMGKEFLRQNLIYCRRTLLEQLLNNQISNSNPFASILVRQKKFTQESISNLDIFKLHFVHSISRHSDEFQHRLNAINAELQKQQSFVNKGIPKEIIRIKEVHHIQTEEKKSSSIDDKRQRQNAIREDIDLTPQYKSQSRNAVQNYNSATHNLSNIDKSQLQQLRNQMNHSMLQPETSELGLPLIQAKSEIKLQRKTVNIGNLDQIPKQLQPLKGPSLLNKQQQRIANQTLTNIKLDNQQRLMNNQQAVEQKKIDDKLHSTRSNQNLINQLQQNLNVPGQPLLNNNLVNLQIPSLVLTQSMISEPGEMMKYTNQSSATKQRRLSKKPDLIIQPNHQ